MEKIKDSFYREKPKFSIQSENIITLKKLMNYSEDKELFEALGWPLEVQGSGRIINDNSFEIRYPKGDKFFSYASIIHELGHLRQDEFINIKSNQDLNIEKEKDAFSRGWSRILEYCPEFIDMLENQFQEHRKQSKIKDFNSFKELYDFYSGTININIALNKLEENHVYDIKDKILALKQAGIDKFFAKINKNKTGEMINKNDANDFIMKVSKAIAKE